MFVKRMDGQPFKWMFLNSRKLKKKKLLLMLYYLFLFNVVYFQAEHLERAGFKVLHHLAS